MTSREIALVMMESVGGYGLGNVGGNYARLIFTGKKNGKLPQNKETTYFNNAGIVMKLTPFVAGSRKQRCFVQCECGVWVTCGRLNQHKCKG